MMEVQSWCRLYTITDYFHLYPERETKMVYRKDWSQPQAGPQGFARTMKVYGRSVNILVPDLATINNVVGCFVVPAGFVLTGLLTTTVPDLDTGATLTLSLGDAALPTRILNASNIGQAGGAMPAAAAGAFLYRYPIDTEIILTATAAAAGGIATAVPIYIQGFMGP